MYTLSDSAADELDRIAREEILGTRSLDKLAEGLRAFYACCQTGEMNPDYPVDRENELRARGVRLDSLPTFGGGEPANTQGIWSWDATRILTNFDADDYAIEPRSSIA